MTSKSYTFILASDRRGTVRRLTVPAYILHLLMLLVVIGGATVLAAVGSYSRLLWKVANYNAVQSERAQLEQKYEQLQSVVKDTNRRLSSLQSLATEVAMTYGIARFPHTPFGLTVNSTRTDDAYMQSVEQFDFLVKNAPALSVAFQGAPLIPGRGFTDASFVPSLWPVMGRLTGSFGERLDPFTGDGGFHAGVDISTDYGTPVRATADGYVVAAENRSGYGRLVVLDHGFGVTSWYGHLSSYGTFSGARVRRGDVVGFVGVSGRSTAPHVHYEVRIHGAPVNPWRYLRATTAD